MGWFGKRKKDYDDEKEVDEAIEIVNEAFEKFKEEEIDSDELIETVREETQKSSNRYWNDKE